VGQIYGTGSKKKGQGREEEGEKKLYVCVAFQPLQSQTVRDLQLLLSSRNRSIGFVKLHIRPEKTFAQTLNKTEKTLSHHVGVLVSK
jgi:hypothetical protein